MKMNARWIGIALIGVAALLLSSNAVAICSTTSVPFGGYYTLFPGNRPARRANFWVLDQGNPAIGVGIDNGSVPNENWIVDADLNGEMAIVADWAWFNYDGCPDNLPNAGATSSMALSISDVNASGNMTYAVICATRSLVSGYYQYHMDYPPGCDGGGCLNPLPMIQGPQATIANIVRGSANDVTVTVASPSFAAGFYGDGTPNCTLTNAIPRYDVYVQQVARGAFPNPSIDAGPWVLSATCNIGSPCTPPPIPSVTNTDIYLAVSPRFNSNFTTGEAAIGGPARVGPRSVIVQAGPILADPPRPHPIPRPKLEPRSPQDER